MVLNLLKRPEGETLELARALERMRLDIRFCEQCFNLSDDHLCSVCKSPSRDEHTICIVKDFQDVIAIENTAQYNGQYHVLGGLISPVEGIGPQDIKIPQLIDRIKEKEVNEIILALSSTMEGDTTEFYIARKVTEMGVKVSTLSKGISVGGELEYTDEISLARSIKNRIEMKD